MANKPSWIPALVLFDDYGGDWNKYLDAVYQFFKQDFVNNQPKFQGKRLGLKRYPIIQGKEATFWHLISEGKYEPDRLPDLRRCERIRWPRPIIESGEQAPLLKVWENTRDGEKRICLWLSFDNEDYLVVLAKREGYLLLWTSYPVIQAHTKRKLQKEYDAYKARAAL
jgi:hypothetical protein